MKPLVYIACSIALIAHQVSTTFRSTPLTPDMEYHTHMAKQQAIEQVMTVLNIGDSCKCLKYAGKKLIACMDYASKEEVRQTFAHLSYQGRIDYLLTMSLLEYKRFLDAFEHENEWEEALTTLPIQEQKLLPQTILAQLIIIRDTWISCAERRVGIYGKGQKDPQANDIAAWRNKTLEGYEVMHRDCPVLWEWLDERFMEQKIKMFYDLRTELVTPQENKK